MIDETSVESEARPSASDEHPGNSLGGSPALGRGELAALALRLSLLVVPLVVLALLWQGGAFEGLITKRQLTASLQWLSASRWAAPALVVLFVVASVVMVPLTLLIVQTAALLGPAGGLAVSAAGALGSAAVTFAIGRRLGRRSLERLLRGRLERARARLARGNTLEVAALRLLPLAPYTAVNVAAGATSLSWRPFLIGTLLGLTPGLVALTVLGERLGAALRDPSWSTLGWLALAAAGLIVLDVALLRRLRRRRRER